MSDGISYHQRVSCLGSGKGNPGSIMYEAMKKVGTLLAEKGVEISTGAYGGIGMKAPLEGAKDGDQLSVRMGFTFLDLPPNRLVNWVMDCHRLAKGIIFPGINVPFLSFGLRLVGLLSANGFIIAAGGRIGTFLEFIAIILFNTKIWGKTWLGKHYAKKRVAILYPSQAKGIRGWNEDMIQHLVDWGFLKEELLSLIEIVQTPEEAVDWVLG